MLNLYIYIYIYIEVIKLLLNFNYLKKKIIYSQVIIKITKIREDLHLHKINLHVVKLIYKNMK
jgi:hypothetical protein